MIDHNTAQASPGPRDGFSADDAMQALHRLCRHARPALEACWIESAREGAGAGRCTVFLSSSSGDERARVAIASGDDFAQAWALAQERAIDSWREAAARPEWLRAEFASDLRAQSWARLQQRFAATKRNYFSDGISFDEDLAQAILPQEIGANALLYDNRIVECHPNVGNLATHGRRRFGRALSWPSDPAQRVWTFRTRGVFTDGQDVHVLEHEGRNQGYRKVADWGADAVLGIVDRATGYLARQVKPSGEYHYGWFPCFDRAIPTYNALRHASSTYALLEGWELTGDGGHRDAIERALGWLCDRLIRPATLPDGTEAAFLVDVGDEIKLGGNAVCLLALGKHAELTDDRSRLPLMERLALGIVHMQDPQRGSFVHVLNYPDLSLKARERTIYYDGEAAFGLMRLYGLTRDPRWLAAVEKAFDHFIAAEHWRAHDHWLSYCVNELTLYRPDARYYRFGLDNVRDHLDFVLQRITTYPTLLELMMAAQKMIARIRADPVHAGLLEGFDLEKFDRALEFRARYLLSGFFWPELAMFFANPRRVLDGFFIRHHSFRVRIDDVEHYLSGYAAYWKHLMVRDAEASSGQAGTYAQPAASAAPSPRLVDGGAERILFLQDDLREVGNGIEIAGIRRAALFHRELGMTPWMLTAAWSPGLRRTETRLKRAGTLPEAVRVLNVHDWVAEMAGDGRLQPLDPGWGVPRDAAAAGAGALSRRRWEVQEAGERLRREEYGTGDGRCFLRKEFVRRGGVFVLRRIMLRFSGQMAATYARERDFVHAMMAANLGRGTFWHLLIDRNRTYRGILQNGLRRELRCSITTILHSTHLLGSGARKGAYWYPLEHPESCDAIVTLTREQHADLLAEGIPAQRLLVIPHWLHPFPEATPDRLPSPPRLVYFARYSPEKRHELLFRVFAEVVRQVPEARLHTFGEGPLKQELRERVAEAGLTASISVGDFVRDIGSEYGSASLGVLPSSEEGFPLAGLESLAHGCPLVAFAIRYGPRDLLEGRDAGVLVEPGDEQAFADAIVALLRDPERLRQLRRGARASASRFTAGQAIGWWRDWWSRMQLVAASGAG